MTEQFMTRMIQRYGAPILRTSGSTVTAYRAIVQPVTSRSWQNMERMVPNAGEIPRGQYIYIGPANQAVKSGDIFTFDGKTYVVRRADRIFLQEEALFVWGLCVEGGVADE